MTNAEQTKASGKRGNGSTQNLAPSVMASNTVPHTQNQALHEKAVRLLTPYGESQKVADAKAYVSSVRGSKKMRDARDTIKSYNERRKAVTAEAREVLAEVWAAFDRDETVGGCAGKKEWCKQVGIFTYRRCCQIISGESQTKRVKSLHLLKELLDLISTESSPAVVERAKQIAEKIKYKPKGWKPAEEKKLTAMPTRLRHIQAPHSALSLCGTSLDKKNTAKGIADKFYDGKFEVVVTQRIAKEAAQKTQPAPPSTLDQPPTTKVGDKSEPTSHGFYYEFIKDEKPYAVRDVNNANLGILCKCKNKAEAELRVATYEREAAEAMAAAIDAVNAVAPSAAPLENSTNEVAGIPPAQREGALSAPQINSAPGALGECELCCDGTPATETISCGLGSGKVCAKCAAFSRESDRKYLIRQMSVRGVCGKFWSWKSLPNERKTVDDGEGGTFTMWSKRGYLEALKKKFLGNPNYDQAVVKGHIASVEKKMEAKAAGKPMPRKPKKTVTHIPNPDGSEARSATGGGSTRATVRTRESRMSESRAATSATA